jgi:hypothetical protein
MSKDLIALKWARDSSESDRSYFRIALGILEFSPLGFISVFFSYFKSHPNLFEYGFYFL